MNLEFRNGVVRGRIRLKLYEKGTKVNVRTCKHGVTLTITKTHIEKHIGSTNSLFLGRTVGATIKSSWFSVS